MKINYISTPSKSDNKNNLESKYIPYEANIVQLEEIQQEQINQAMEIVQE